MDANSKALESESIKVMIWRYSWPAIIAATATPLYNIIDRIFIGQGVGALAISGLALTFPIMSLSTALGTLVGAGSAAVVSLQMGEKKHQKAVLTLGNATLLNIIIGVAFSVLSLIFLDPILYLFGASDATIPYARDFMRIILIGNVIPHLFFGLNNIIRASGYPTKAMLSLLLTIGVNLILAPLSIFAFHWGIKGAATATVISQSIGLLCVLSHFISKKNNLRYEKGCFRFSWTIIRQITSIGVAPFILHCLTCLIVILINRQLGYYGGDLCIGSYGIVNTLLNVLIMMVFGLSQGMQPIVGYNWGAKQRDRALNAFKLTMLYSFVFGLVGLILFELFPRTIGSVFTDNEEMIGMVVEGLRVTILFFPAACMQIIATNFFQAIGKAGVSVFLSSTRQLIFLIPLLLILPPFFGTMGVWSSWAIADLQASLVTAAVLLHFRTLIRKP